MNKSLQKLDIISEQFLSKPLTRYWKTSKEDRTYCFVIPDRIKRMLLNTKVPRKPNLFKLPFDNIFLDVRLENDSIVIPYGIFIATNNDMCDEKEEAIDDEEKKLMEQEFDYRRTFHIYFSYYFKGFENHPLEFIHLSFFGMIEPIKENCYLEEIWNVKTIQRIKEQKENVFPEPYCGYVEDGNDYFFNDHPRYNYKYWKIINQKHIISFICNYLLFLNDPRVKQIVHQGRIKKFKKKEYFFDYPRSVTTFISNELQKYIDDYTPKKTGVKFHYQYKFIVRGHFRRLKNKKMIWITPYYKGKGLFIKKDYQLKNKSI